jgi:hypothetical protein
LLGDMGLALLHRAPLRHKHAQVHLGCHARPHR